MRRVVQLAIRAYKRWLSPMLPVACRYVPTCSEYAEEAVEHYGVIRGGMMAVWRLLRCHPFGGSGYDPVVKSAEWEVRSESIEATHIHSEPGSACRVPSIQVQRAPGFTRNSKVEIRNS
jgi:hypothetical protein